MAKASASRGEGFRKLAKPDPKFARFMTKERSRNARDFLAGYRTFSPEHGDNPIHIGRMVRKVRSGREGQITAITETHAVVHWPDYEDHRNNPEQTYVRLDRFRRAKEWELL